MDLASLRRMAEIANSPFMKELARQQKVIESITRSAAFQQQLQAVQVATQAAKAIEQLRPSINAYARFAKSFDSDLIRLAHHAQKAVELAEQDIRAGEIQPDDLAQSVESEIETALNRKDLDEDSLDGLLNLSHEENEILRQEPGALPAIAFNKALQTAAFMVGLGVTAITNPAVFMAIITIAISLTPYYMVRLSGATNH